MKRFREIAIRLIPMVLIVAITLVLSLYLYTERLSETEEDCWEELRMAAMDVSHEVNIRFTDNIKMLDLAADAMDLEKYSHAELLEHISFVHNETIYDRIDVMFPDGNILLMNGDYASDEERIPYDGLVEKGAHLSTRRTDPYTDKEVIYYFTPIVTDGETQGILIGMVDCEYMGDLFHSKHYDGEGEIFMTDLRDGSFVVDNWHDSLGNIKELEASKMADGFEDVDFVEDILRGHSGHAAFESSGKRKTAYMAYEQVENLPFAISLVVPDEQIFADVDELHDTLVVVGLVEFALLITYFVWHTIMVAIIANSREKQRLAQLEQDKNEAKSRFLSSVSHDIRTPLNGIIGMLDVIRLRGSVPESMVDPLHKIDVSAKYLLSLANDVLDMNELETGKIVFSRDAINLKELVGDLGIIMKPRAKEKGVEYKSDCSGLRCANVLGSSVHINKILSNLIGNAIKYNREGGSVQVTVEESPVGDRLRNYIFTVSDTGIGISDEFKKSMFNAFEQEEMGARTANMGHGLGLSIVKRLVDQMEGTITVESEKNVGTTFVVTLPLETDTDIRAREPELPQTEDLVGAKVLIVEDNELNLEIAAVILSESGAEVFTAMDGSLAVDAFRNSRAGFFDAVLMDIMMPEMDGHEATKAIRAMDRPDAKTVPIIAMTASTFSEDIRKCRDSGMNDHLGKPIDMNTLVVKLTKQISAYRGKR